MLRINKFNFKAPTFTCNHCERAKTSLVNAGFTYSDADIIVRHKVSEAEKDNKRKVKYYDKYVSKSHEELAEKEAESLESKKQEIFKNLYGDGYTY